MEVSRIRRQPVAGEADFKVFISIFLFEMQHIFSSQKQGSAGVSDSERENM